MKSLDYYMSIRPDPHTQNNEDTQDMIDERALFQFKFDSLTKMIGTPECKYNIDLFFDEFFQEADDDQKANFYQECLLKLIEVYDLEVFQDDQIDRQPPFNIEKEMREMLHFFEKNKWVEYLVKYLPVENPKIIFSNSFNDYLRLHFSVFIKNMMKDKEELPYLIRKYFLLAAKNDAIETLMKLISKDKNLLATEYYLKLEGM